MGTLGICCEGGVGRAGWVGPPLLPVVGERGRGEPGDRAGVSLLLSCHTRDTCSSAKENRAIILRLFT